MPPRSASRERQHPAHRRRNPHLIPVPLHAVDSQLDHVDQHRLTRFHAKPILYGHTAPPGRVNGPRPCGPCAEPSRCARRRGGCRRGRRAGHIRCDPGGKWARLPRAGDTRRRSDGARSWSLGHGANGSCAACAHPERGLAGERSRLPVPEGAGNMRRLVGHHSSAGDPTRTAHRCRRFRRGGRRLAGGAGATRRWWGTRRRRSLVRSRERRRSRVPGGLRSRYAGGGRGVRRTRQVCTNTGRGWWPDQFEDGKKTRWLQVGVTYSKVARLLYVLRVDMRLMLSACAVRESRPVSAILVIPKLLVNMSALRIFLSLDRPIELSGPHENHSCPSDATLRGKRTVVTFAVRIGDNKCRADIGLGDIGVRLMRLVLGEAQCHSTAEAGA
jgi:hypothetical protein